MEERAKDSSAKAPRGSLRVRERTNWGSFVLLVAISAVVMLPVWWIIRSSLMTNNELYSMSFFPSEWLWSNYASTLEFFNYWKYLANTAMVVVPAVIFGTVTATLCGYAFGRLRFRGKKLWFGLSVGSMLLPNMVTLIPLYIMWTRGLGLSDTYYPLVLPYLCGGGAFSIFLIRQFVRSIPRELDEAATIDGAGYLRILVQIIVPAIKPAMIVVGLFIFVGIWNDLLQQTVYLNSEEKFTIVVGLSMIRGGLKADWARIMCATVLAFLPGIAVYLAGQRYFVEGIVMSGMKN